MKTEFLIFAAVMGGAAWVIFKRTPTTREYKSGVTGAANTAIQTDVTGASSFATGAMAGVYDAIAADAAGIKLAPSDTLDNVGYVYDPYIEQQARNSIVTGAADASDAFQPEEGYYGPGVA